MSFHERKAYRTDRYYRFRYGWRLRTCTACSGSGKYDHNNSPDCQGCGGTGKERYQFKFPPKKEPT